MTLINISNKAKNCLKARVVGRQYFAKYLTPKDGYNLLVRVEYWLLIEIQNTRWDRDAINSALEDVRGRF